MNEKEFDRAARAWLDDGPTRISDRALLSALEEVHTTRQRRVLWPAWIPSRMTTVTKLFAAAAAVLLVAVVGYQFLPGNGGVGGPSSTTLASGTFTAKGASVELDARGDGDGVTGTMTVSDDVSGFTIDLQCALTAEDGRLLIGGDTTESTMFWATKGDRTAIVLKPGSPVHAVFFFELRGAPAASCMAFLDGLVDEVGATVIGPDALEPIQGTVAFGP